MAPVNPELLARVDMNEISKDPEKARLRFPKWLFQHDPEAYVYENYGQAFTYLLSGAGLSEHQCTSEPSV